MRSANERRVSGVAQKSKTINMAFKKFLEEKKKREGLKKEVELEKEDLRFETE